MYSGYPYYPYRPYAIPIHGEEIPIQGAKRRKSEDVEQIITKHMRIAEEIQRRMVSIDERFERIEKMIQEKMGRNA
ncbi:hypothetical protein ACFO25_14365 [Paenactinomyces guangxiensis]|uniref:Uncharacterized protein n=1 Tax=Paenactinomyces guangxiensis TaxID=1490290 RepID=A0A7W2A6Z2_9BACL|nr:hypothetical protein [Paenactinomyces guangxiensis]MBA4493951.1 hypothetical protein [Paenactinomyces guangxiensis]MBH8591418.1 hypothetical protein [Paenactinomyces guangxiensis]